MHKYQETIQVDGGYVQKVTLFAKILNCKVDCDDSNVVLHLQEKSLLVLNEHTDYPTRAT